MSSRLMVQHRATSVDLVVPRRGTIEVAPPGWYVMRTPRTLIGPVFAREIDAQIGRRALLETEIDWDAPNWREQMYARFPVLGDGTKHMVEHLQW